MKKFRILLFLLIIPWLNTFSQSGKVQLDFSFLAGYSTYDMADLKEVNLLTQQSLPFDVINVNNFDPGYFYGGSLRTKLFSNVALGLYYQHNSTGSRIGQKDYSGIYTFDQIIDCDLAGLEPEYMFLNKKRFGISTSVQAGVLFSKIDIKDYLKVGETIIHNTQKLTAFSIIFCPTLKISVPVINPVGLFITAGRMIDSGGIVHHFGNKDAILKTGENDVRTGWSGWRLSAGLKINLTKQKLKE
jgi:hypothetical protein